MVKAAIFDFDGTLIDSEPHYAHSFQKLMQKRGLPIRDKFHGIGIGGTVKALKEKFPGAANWDEFGKEFFDSFHHCTMQAQVFEGAPQLLKELFTTMPLAICSNSSRRIVSDGLEKNNLSKYFELLVTREDFVKAKPDPEPYYKTCQLLKIAPEECVVFEDSLPGLQAAKAANCKTVLFNSNNYPAELVIDADFVTKSYRNITPSLLQEI